MITQQHDTSIICNILDSYLILGLLHIQTELELDQKLNQEQQQKMLTRSPGSDGRLYCGDPKARMEELQSPSGRQKSSSSLKAFLNLPGLSQIFAQISENCPTIFLVCFAPENNAHCTIYNK